MNQHETGSKPTNAMHNIHNMPNLPILGWREWIGLPDIDIELIEAKVDTGAKTSCLHAFDVEPFTPNDPNQSSQPTWVRFKVHLDNDKLDSNNLEQVAVCERPIVDQRNVTDSGGHTEQRYVIELTVQLGAASFNTQFTLTNRDTMQFRILLGRRALRKRYLVNSAASNLMAKPTTYKPTKTD